MIETTTRRDVPAKAFVRTYDNPSYADPWDAIEDYERVQRAAARHPEKGSSALSRIVDLPRGRIRSWVDAEGMPDAYRGLQVALDRGWLHPNPNSSAGRALVELSAHIVAGGSINDNYVPAVSVGRRVSADEIETTFRTLGVESVERHADSENRATEILPADDASVLGRCLVALGIPHGSKQEMTSLPHVVHTVSRLHRTLFATTYARHRAVEYETKSTIRIAEERPQEYLESLGELFRDVTGERVAVGIRGLTLSADAARDLGLAE